MKVTRISKGFFINLTILLSIFTLDRLTKLYVIYLDNINNGSEILISKYLNIYLVWNKGVSFGLLSFDKLNAYNFLSLLIGCIILILIFMLPKNYGLKKYALLMIIGGAIGNLSDRITYNAVPDFIDFHIGNFHWFVFNVSDIFITIGVIIVIVLELINKKKNDEI
jgi:signal peptidase II|tara:strand:- start:7157 stop:7654 length:498 start_codon:yes stop_codon:yes gene_type:complete